MARSQKMSPHTHDDLARLHRSMTPEQRVALAFKLSSLSAALAAAGAKARERGS